MTNRDNTPGRISISKQPDGWHVTRPAFGFAAQSTTIYTTGAAAIRSLTASGLGSGGGQLERSP